MICIIMIDAIVIQTLHEIIILTLQSKPIVKLLICALNILLQAQVSYNLLVQAASIRVLLDSFLKQTYI